MGKMANGRTKPAKLGQEGAVTDENEQLTVSPTGEVGME